MNITNQKYQFKEIFPDTIRKIWNFSTFFILMLRWELIRNNFAIQRVKF